MEPGDDLAELRDRVRIAGQELGRLEARLRELDEARAAAAGEERLAEGTSDEWLRESGDPDVRFVRAWHPKLVVITLGTFVVALGFAIAGRIGGAVAMSVLSALVLQLASLRAVIDRRRGACDVRLPWSPRALVATRPIAPDQVAVRRKVRRSKGTTEITYAVEAGDVELASGRMQGEAEALAAEVRRFLESARREPRAAE